MNDYPTAAELVAKGAALLDKHAPGWYRFEHDWADLNMWAQSKCVLGQLALNGQIPGVKNYAQALNLLGLGTWGSKGGFCPSNEVETEDLVREWKRVILDRRSSAPQDTAAAVSGTAVFLNPTERQLLIDMLEVREYELTSEQELLKPQYREFLNPPIMTTRALRLAIKAAV